MPFIINNTYKSTVFTCSVDRIRHSVQKQIRTYNCTQLPVMVNRHCTHNADLAAENICHHISKKETAGFNCPGIPWSFTDGDGNQIPVL